MYTGIRLLLLIHPFISSFFLSLQFSTLKFFVTFFLGTVRPRRLKLGTHLDSGQMYHVYRNQAAAAYSSLYFFIFLSLQFSTLKFFVTLFSGTVMPRRLKLGTHVDSGKMYHVYRNQAAAAYSSLYFFILALLWKRGGYIGFALSFRHSVTFRMEIFRHFFLRNCEA